MSPARRRPQGEPESFVNFEDAASMADPAVSALLNQAQRRQEEAHLPRREREKKKKEREKIRARRPYHTTYDIPLELRQRIKQLAERHGVPASQLATLGLLRFVEDLAENKVDVDAYKVASRSPRYDFNLAIPAEEYLATFGQPVRKPK